MVVVVRRIYIYEIEAISNCFVFPRTSLFHQTSKYTYLSSLVLHHHPNYLFTTHPSHPFHHLSHHSFTTHLTIHLTFSITTVFDFRVRPDQDGKKMIQALVEKAAVEVELVYQQEVVGGNYEVQRGRKAEFIRGAYRGFERSV